MGEMAGAHQLLLKCENPEHYFDSFAGCSLQLPMTNLDSDVEKMLGVYKNKPIFLLYGLNDVDFMEVGYPAWAEAITNYWELEPHAQVAPVEGSCFEVGKK